MPRSESRFVIHRKFASYTQKAFVSLSLSTIIALCLVAGDASFCLAVKGMEENARETLSISLRGNPSAGQFWSWTAEGDGVVRETNIVYR